MRDDPGLRRGGASPQGGKERPPSAPLRADAAGRPRSNTPQPRRPARSSRGLLIGCGLLLTAAAASAIAQGRLDADAFKAFGGDYRINCGDSASPKATVAADALLIEQGSKRVTGRNVQNAPSFLGPNPGPAFRTVLLGEVGGQQLLFVLYEDRSGAYLVIDGDPKLTAAIGKPLVGSRLRRCGGAPRTAQAPAAPQRRHALDELSAAGLLQDPQARAAYHKALGPLVREPWLARLDGPSPQNKPVKVAGADFILASACKPRDCADHNTVLLYSALRQVVFGKVYQKGRSTLIGAPPPAVAAELERLWKTEWRQGR